MAFDKKRKLVPYVPRYLPPQLAPEAITWGNDANTRARIISLFKENKSNEEISEITRCRLAFVRAVVKRYLHPDEFAPLPQPRRKIAWAKIACKNCGKEFEVVPWIAKRGRRKFCSMRCLWEGREKRRAGR